jgi:hypothetical protein
MGDDDDVEQTIIDALEAGSAEGDQREQDTCKASTEMVSIVAEMVRIARDTGAWPWPPEEKMRREAMLIAKWPEACRRAGVGAIPMPDHVMHAIISFGGRAS